MLTIDNPRTFDWANMPIVECAEGNAADAHFTLKLFYIFEEKLEELGVTKLYETLVSSVTEVFADIEFAGLDVSQEVLPDVGRELRIRNINAEDDLYNCYRVEKVDNLSSNKDLIDILYLRDTGFGLYPPDKTAKNSPSVSAPTLKILLEHIEEELRKRSN